MSECRRAGHPHRPTSPRENILQAFVSCQMAFLTYSEHCETLRLPQVNKQYRHQRQCFQNYKYCTRVAPSMGTASGNAAPTGGINFLSQFYLTVSVYLTAGNGKLEDICQYDQTVCVICKAWPVVPCTTTGINTCIEVISSVVYTLLHWVTGTNVCHFTPSLVTWETVLLRLTTLECYLVRK